MDAQNGTQPTEPPQTPPHPPYSPITPVLSHASMLPPPSPSQQIIPPLAPSPFTLSGSTRDTSAYAQTSTSNAPPTFIPEPVPIPISESDNPDAIALRSAISILQIQKQQALRDIQTLDRMKQAAVANPESFARELANGNLASNAGDLLNPSGPEGEEEKEDVRLDTSHTTMEVDDAPPQPPSFGKIPNPQKVVRMPAINWAKYHIVGEPLDKLHDEQRRRPSPGEPRRDEMTPQRAPEHFVAAPYRPFTDVLEPSMKTRSTGKGKK
ncbi:hypothetical protein FQN51_002592 [Onygenales sp. PD_10]|nr:hypothetical protein FQN51_002592 [Onygenales sp. PD_10]